MERTLLLNSDLCKGCGICVAFCPRHALELKDGKAALQSGHGCVLCGLCEQRCPDYAIFVNGESEAAQ